MDLQLELEVDRFVSAPKPIGGKRLEPASAEGTPPSLSGSLSASSTPSSSPSSLSGSSVALPPFEMRPSDAGCGTDSLDGDQTLVVIGKPATLDPFSEHLPHELFLKVLFLLGPRESGRVARVCRVWREFALDDSNWAMFFRKRFGALTAPLAVGFVRGHRWSEAFRIRSVVERRFAAQERLQLMRDDRDAVRARKCVERADYLEHLLNLQRSVHSPAPAELRGRTARDLLHAFLYEEYAGTRAREHRFDWVERNFARRLCAHAQELRRQKRCAEAQRLLELCIDICTQAYDRAKSAARPPTNATAAAVAQFQPLPVVPAQSAPSAADALLAADGLSVKNFVGVGVVWATALINVGQLELELRRNRARADELFLSAQKMLLHLHDTDPYKCFNLACIYALCGQAADCRKWLAEAFEQGNLNMHWFAEESDFDAVRDQRWFSELLAKVAERDRERVRREAEAQRSAERCAVM